LLVGRTERNTCTHCHGELVMGDVFKHKRKVQLVIELQFQTVFGVLLVLNNPGNVADRLGGRVEVNLH